MGTELNYNTTFHPQTDGQTERVNQVLEDLLRACVLTYGSDWEKNLSYAEFFIQQQLTGQFEDVTTPSEIIPYYHLNHSILYLSDNKESSR
jgi:hypothetical protein